MKQSGSARWREIRLFRANARNVLKGDGLVGQAGGSHEGHGLVLVALGLDFPADRVAPPNKKAPVGDVRHERKMP